MTVSGEMKIRWEKELFLQVLPAVDIQDSAGDRIV